MNWHEHPNPFIRIAGTHPPASAVLADFFRQADAPPVHVRSALPAAGPGAADADDFDYTQIDPALRLERFSGRLPHPAANVGYAGLSPAQRRAFAIWLSTPERKGTPAFQRLYLAYLECHLLSGPDARRAAIPELQKLLAAPTWRSSTDLRQVALLAAWLDQNGPLIGQILAHWWGTPELAGTALGWQAFLGSGLTPELASVLIAAHIRTDGGLESSQKNGPKPTSEAAETHLTLSLTSLVESLQAEPLAYALGQALGRLCPMSEKSNEPQTGRVTLLACESAWKIWRCVHRDLRLRLPQVDLLPDLSPILQELAELMAQERDASDGPDTARERAGAYGAAEPPSDGTQSASARQKEWTLVLEFRESRAALYDFMLEQARKMRSYQMLMDENRQILHRVTFTRQDMRRFWRIWEGVQGWTSTRVYINGEEVDKSMIWPYSHVLL